MRAFTWIKITEQSTQLLSSSKIKISELGFEKTGSVFVKEKFYLSSAQWAETDEKKGQLPIEIERMFSSAERDKSTLKNFFAALAVVDNTSITTLVVPFSCLARLCTLQQQRSNFLPHRVPFYQNF